jgi:hypothetical protein
MSNEKNNITNLFYKRAMKKKSQLEWNDPENAERRRLMMHLDNLKQVREQGSYTEELTPVFVDQSIMEIENRLGEYDTPGDSKLGMY